MKNKSVLVAVIISLMVSFSPSTSHAGTPWADLINGSMFNWNAMQSRADFYLNTAVEVGSRIVNAAGVLGTEVVGAIGAILTNPISTGGNEDQIMAQINANPRIVDGQTTSINVNAVQDQVPVVYSQVSTTLVYDMGSGGSPIFDDGAAGISESAGD